ncbi:hypothetical protein TNCV_1601301 [Trichonephila clavipes]|nr:hypothetical protein TNCV_1601301 [Trichonephila clavipes]
MSNSIVFVIILSESRVSLKVEYVTPPKVTCDVASLLFRRSRDSYSTIGRSLTLAVDFETSGWRGNSLPPHC